MVWELTAAHWVNLAGAFAILGLGAFVWWQRPRQTHIKRFGTFLIAWSLLHISRNLQDATWASDLVAWMTLFGGVAAMVAGVVFALFALRPFGSTVAGRRILPQLVFWSLLVQPAMVLVALFAFPDALLGEPGPVTLDFALVADVVWLLGVSVFVATGQAGLIHWAASAARHGRRGQWALLSAGLGSYVAVGVAGTIDGWERLATGVIERATLIHFFLSVAFILLAAGIWLQLARGPDSRIGRNTGLFLLAMLTAAVFMYAFAPESVAQGVPGIARLIGALVLVFAILRHQLFGLEVRVKWTIKTSTIAAIFVAVFFVASEAAASFFGDRTGNQYWGIAAAGLLVFAFAPLQRLAERLSDKALPGVKSIVHMDDSEKAFAYEQAARAAWADGSLSRDERAMLDRIRDALGLAQDDATRIERDALL